MRVNFLLAGVQKGSTTALYQMLRDHPELYLPQSKELHYFDNESLDWASPDHDRHFHGHFAEAPDGAVCGEATPIYTYWAPSLRRIKDYNPDMKLIVSLRDPVQRAYSHWRMETLRGAERLSFSEAIRSGRRRVVEQAEVADQHRVFSYVERGYYGWQISRLLLSFDSTQLFFLAPNDLRNRRRETLDDICRFLGVDAFDAVPETGEVFSHVNCDVPPLSDEDANYLSGLYSDDVDMTRRLLRSWSHAFHHGRDAAQSEAA